MCVLGPGVVRFKFVLTGNKTHEMLLISINSTDFDSN